MDFLVYLLKGKDYLHLRQSIMPSLSEQELIQSMSGLIDTLIYRKMKLKSKSVGCLRLEL